LASVLICANAGYTGGFFMKECPFYQVYGAAHTWQKNAYISTLHK
jgi:hypothetical protein